VFKKDKQDRDILFIDASREFEKAKNQNKLKPEHIDKIVETYKNRQDMDKYAHVASLDEIKENEYNLNIPRYVDTFEPEEEINLEEIQKLIEQDENEIAELQKVINEQLRLLGV
jgi:type I restriction enzyme M protein